jgi:alpha-maltose-1-phosphate synthase
MRITQLTNEYPPHVYGGAGVHIEYLSRALAGLEPGGNKVDVLCFGDQESAEGDLSARGITPAFTLPSQNARHAKLMDTLARDLMMAGSVTESDVVHCHTWYAHFAGCLVKQLLRVPLVLTTHSLEPHRPWKVEQLGNAYHASTWLEKTAYRNADGVIAVSEAMKRDVQELYGVAQERIRVIPNGIDIAEYAHKPDPGLLRRLGGDPDKPFVLFVGRITRQKGILHLLNALARLPEDTQVVLCAGAPDTVEIGTEMRARVEALRARRPDLSVLWIESMLPREEIIALYSMAAVFVCPSVYEPFGIINLEAMACGACVVAARVGGIQANRIDQGQFLYENLMIGANVIEASRLANVEKLVALGSSCIYPRETAQPISENALLTGRLEPTNEGYAIAKIAHLEITKMYRRQYGFKAISLMPRFSRDSDVRRLVPRFVPRIVRTRRQLNSLWD